MDAGVHEEEEEAKMQEAREDSLMQKGRKIWQSWFYAMTMIFFTGKPENAVNWMQKYANPRKQKANIPTFLISINWTNPLETYSWKYCDGLVIGQCSEKVQKIIFLSPGIGFVSKFPEDEDDDGRFLVHSVRPHRERGGRGVVKGDWLFTPPLYQKAFNCFLFTNKFWYNIYHSSIDRIF